jgi:tRNA-modifying protein YgfZ
MTNHSQNNPNLATPLFSGATTLPQWGLILVEGADAASFLQNQLSNSVLGLKRTFSPEIAQPYAATRLVGYCNPKGRLLASAWLGLFPVSQDSEDRFALFISRDIASSFAKRLSMYVLRSKVTVKDVSDLWVISGIYDESKALESEQIQLDSLFLRMPDVTLNKCSYSRTLVARPLNSGYPQPKDSIDQLQIWNYLEVMSAIPRILLATQEQFVPQMVNFESVAGIDFKKGCYPGQEIVARSQYRGAIKRRLQLAHAGLEQETLTQCIPGGEVFLASDPKQPAGMIVLAAQNPFKIDRIDLQVECKLEALESGELRIGSAEGPLLQIDSLPYPLIEI